MIVYDKATNERVDVFDITYDKSGFPHFLIFKDNQWIRMSAKHFIPYVKFTLIDRTSTNTGDNND